MATVPTAISDMSITVKSREIQRGMSAESRGDSQQAAKHFLAAAHLELVLASDYETAGEPALARRSRISAATCFWRAGRRDLATAVFDELRSDDPAAADEVERVMDELQAV